MSQEPAPQKLQENMSHAVGRMQQEVSQQHEPWYKLSKKAIVLIIIYLVQFLLFALLALFVHAHPILPIDVAITREFQENRSPWLQWLMEAVSFLGNQALLFFGLIVLTVVVLWILRLRLEALTIIALSVVSDVTNVAVKLIVNRPRPNMSLVDVFQQVSGQSFPSGHVMSYVAYWGLLFSFGLILFKRERWWSYAILIIPALFVVLVGPSRIYLGAHWASDVLGGYMFSGALLGITLWIYLPLKRRGVLTTPLAREKKKAAPLLPVQN